MVHLLALENIKLDRNKFPKDEIEDELLKQFQIIADELINHYSIVKEQDGSSKKATYHFMELEFYFCSPEHPDIITYPRNAKAGDWFFHTSGVDLCFESKVELNPETGKVVGGQKTYGFGGILIRALSKHVEEEETTYITGPLKCCYELFDQFSAFNSPKNFPIIQKDDHSENDRSSSCGRYFHFGTSLDQKLINIVHDNWEETVDDMNVSIFESYLRRNYCFYDEKAFQEYHKDQKGAQLKKSYNAIPSGTANRLKYK